LAESSPRLHGGVHTAAVDNSRASFTPHTPVQNQILAALPPDLLKRLLPDLELVPLPLGWVVHGAGQKQRYLFFLTEGIVARIYETETGDSAAFAFTGNEGVIGVASFLGGESTPSQAVVISPGIAFRLEARLMQSEFEHDSPLPRLLLRYTQALIAQIGQSVVCNRRHSVEQQMCRLILSCLDRLPSNELPMTQELIAGLLGVRRESITEAAGKLQQEGLILYRRGHIAVLDRRQLNAHACECYGVVRDELDRLLSPEDTIGHTGQRRPATRYQPKLVNGSRARRQRRSTCSTALASAQRSDGR
jgi:CRP-like cAMP-binding protein